jgi:hypothetical protein
MGVEVRDADRLGPAGAVDLLQRLPRLDVVDVDGRQRPVDEEQVDVVELQLGERPVEGPERVVPAVEAVVELGGHEDLLARDAGVADALADALLVPVHLGGVDVPVTDLQGGLHRLRGLLRLDLVDAEAELRDLHAVVQGDRGHGGHERSSTGFVGLGGGARH